MSTVFHVRNIHFSFSLRVSRKLDISQAFSHIAVSSKLQHQEQSSHLRLKPQILWTTMSSSENIESPRKRVKLFPDGQALIMPKSADMPAETISAMLQQDRAAHTAKEAEVGITA